MDWCRPGPIVLLMAPLLVAAREIAQLGIQRPTFENPWKATMTRISPILLFLAIALFSATSSRAIEAGDLLVLDHHGARVLAVRPETGSLSVVSPRAGSGPNLLVAPTGIVMCHTGMIYVSDAATNRLVEIDAATGAQRILLTKVFSLSVPANVGLAPWGLTTTRDGPDGVPNALDLCPGTGEPFDETRANLLVAARDSAEIRLLYGSATPGHIRTQQWLAHPQLAATRALSFRPSSYLATELLLARGSAGVSKVFTQLVLGDIEVDPVAIEPFVLPVGVYGGAVEMPGGNVLATRRLEVFPERGFPFCTELSGVWKIGQILPLPASDGGWFRCPIAIVADAIGNAYVTDVARPPPFAGGARIVRLSPPGAWNVQTLVVEIPNAAGTAAYPVAITRAPVAVPEANAAAGAFVALSSLCGYRRFARRSARRC